jgi:hypothetical protein
MIKKILFAIGIFFLIVFFSAIHIGLAYLLPYPFSKMNLIFVLLILTIVWWESGWVVWISFFAHFLIELYSLAPFGITIFAATLAILFTFWLYESVITNRSWVASILLLFLSLMIYRVLYIAAIFATYIFLEQSVPEIGFLFLTFYWEVLFSCLLLVILHVLALPFTDRQHAMS